MACKVIQHNFTFKNAYIIAYIISAYGTEVLTSPGSNGNMSDYCVLCVD